MVDIMVSDFKKGRYNLMKIFVGIDIAKLNHFAAAISSDGEILLEPFKFTNDADGFQLLVSKLESFDKNSIIIGLESTAHYGDNLVRYLVAEFYQVCRFCLHMRWTVFVRHPFRWQRKRADRPVPAVRL